MWRALCMCRGQYMKISRKRDDFNRSRLSLRFFMAFDLHCDESSIPTIFDSCLVELGSLGCHLEY